MANETDNRLIMVVAGGATVFVLLMICMVVATVVVWSMSLSGADEGEVVAVAELEVTPTATPEPTRVVVTRTEAPDAARYTWVEYVSGFDNPLFVGHADDGSGRLFVMEQTGYILVVEDGEILPQPFLNISQMLSDDVFQGGYSERGLLGLAFHPDFENNGTFFISHTDRDGNSILARYQVMRRDPNRADPNSRVELLRVAQPFADHNGGNLTFGPDGYLYMGFGDGGNPNLPNYNSQDPRTLLGKILRLDVDDVDAEDYAIPESNPFVGQVSYRPEIWALGVRNPWRFTFDRATGDMYMGDVGQWAWEEVNFQSADSTGGENYGWSAYEGTHVYLEDEEVFSEVTMPVYEYEHASGCSVTGGYVYRGPEMPELHGAYFFGDYCNGFIWTMYRDPDGVWQVNQFMDSDAVITSFGEDEQGELYMVDYKGAIYRLAPVP